MRQDQLGRWLPLKKNRHETLDELRKGQRNFVMAIFPPMEDTSSHEAEAMAVRGRIYLTRRDTDEVRWKTLSEGEQEKSWKVVETAYTGVVRFRPVTIISPEEASKILHAKQPRVILSDWSCAGRKQTADILQKHDGACMNSKTPVERSCPLHQYFDASSCLNPTRGNPGRRRGNFHAGIQERTMRTILCLTSTKGVARRTGRAVDSIGLPRVCCFVGCLGGDQNI